MRIGPTIRPRRLAREPSPPSPPARRFWRNQSASPPIRRQPNFPDGVQSVADCYVATAKFIHRTNLYRSQGPGRGRSGELVRELRHGDGDGVLVVRPLRRAVVLPAPRRQAALESRGIVRDRSTASRVMFESKLGSFAKAGQAPAATRLQLTPRRERGRNRVPKKIEWSLYSV